MCNFMQKMIQTLATDASASFPVGSTQISHILTKLLRHSISDDTVRRIIKRYNRFCDDYGIARVEHLESQLTVGQLESLFYFIISFIEPDRREPGREYTRSEASEQSGIPINTIDDYRDYAVDYDIRFGYRDNEHPIFTDHDIKILNRIRKEGKECLTDYAKWPVTQFIEHFPNKPIKKPIDDKNIPNLPLLCSGIMGYKGIPAAEFKRDAELFEAIFIEISTSQIRMMITEKYIDEQDEKERVEPIWLFRVMVDENTVGKTYRGNYYWLFDTGTNNGEIEFDVSYDEDCLLLSGQYHVKGESVDKFTDIFLRVLPKSVPAPMVPSYKDQP